ncbi:MAG: zinc ribbon domain-containing protein [Phycisphaerae bacterium]|nr:zinc ribbon domain-containing protein [Phycisphaerae bacterium]
MPIYEFYCENCDHRFEMLVASMKSNATPQCTICSGPTKKLLSNFSAHNSSATPACGPASDSCQMAQNGSCPGGSCPFSQ